jgi:hypothetical protein
MQVDVFTNRPFAGNPVAVVFDADDLPTERMQQIARWTNRAFARCLPLRNSKSFFWCLPSAMDNSQRQDTANTWRAVYDTCGLPAFISAVGRARVEGTDGSRIDARPSSGVRACILVTNLVIAPCSGRQQRFVAFLQVARDHLKPLIRNAETLGISKWIGTDERSHEVLPTFIDQPPTILETDISERDRLLRSVDGSPKASLHRIKDVIGYRLELDLRKLADTMLVALEQLGEIRNARPRVAGLEASTIDNDRVYDVVLPAVTPEDLYSLARRVPAISIDQTANEQSKAVRIELLDHLANIVLSTGLPRRAFANGNALKYHIGAGGYASTLNENVVAL